MRKQHRRVFEGIKESLSLVLGMMTVLWFAEVMYLLEIYTEEFTGDMI